MNASSSTPPAAGQAAHTPTPWATAGCSIYAGEEMPSGRIAPNARYIGVTAPIGEEDMPSDEDLANAAFIVTACNAHAGLVTALTNFLELDMRTGRYDHLRINPAGADGMTEDEIAYLDYVDHARAALANLNR